MFFILPHCFHTSLAINLDADQIAYDSHALATPSTLPVSNQPAHFSRGLTVYDELGSAQTVTLEYRKVVGPMAHATTNSGTTLSADDIIAGAGAATGVLSGISNGEAITITMGNTGTTETFEFVDTAGAGVIPGANEIVTVQDYINALNSFGTGAEIDARLSPSGQVLMQAIDPSDQISIANVGAGDAVDGGATTLNYVPDPLDGNFVYNADFDITTTPFTDTAATGYTQTDFPAFDDTSTPNTQGWWELTILHPDGTAISQGLLNFDGSGQLNAAEDSEGNIDVELQNIDWGNGSSLQDFTIDIERLSQFAGNYDVIFSDQDGAELGLRTGVEINREGQVIARFSNGASATLYQIPLITFANQNGLNEVSGTAYTENDESGEENLREAGTGGAGFVEPSTLESSNVDLADEFARLIVAQRAFGAGTRTINTVDQMTQDLLSLR